MDGVTRLTLLPKGLSHQYVVPRRPSTMCAICGQPFRSHDDGVACDCGRCGLESAWACYWARVASPGEWDAFLRSGEDDVTGSRYILLCDGCRS